MPSIEAFNRELSSKLHEYMRLKATPSIEELESIFKHLIFRTGK
jgi:hypothetical protein